MFFFVNTPQRARACGVFIGFYTAWNDAFFIILLPITVFDRH